MNSPWTRRERLTLLTVVVCSVLWLLSGALFGDLSTLSMRPDDPRIDLRPWAAGDPGTQQAVNPITPDIDGFVLPGIARARQLEESAGNAHWDGSQLLGLPFAANMAWPLASPVTWGVPRLYESLTGEAIDPVTLLDVMLAVHLILALLLAYRACRMLGAEPPFAAAGAVGFAFSTWMFTRWHAPHIVYTTAWWPGQVAALQWLAQGHRRRGVLEGGLITGLMLLSGFPQVGVILTGLTVGVALLDPRLRSPKIFAGVLSIGLLGVALAAPQLLLNKGAFAQSLRADPDVQASVASRGLPAASLLGAVIPEAFGHPPAFSLPSRPAPTMESWVPQRLWWSHQIQNSVVENALYPGALLLLLLGILWRRGVAGRARALVFCALLTVIAAMVAPYVVAAVPALQSLAAGNVKRALVIVGVSLPLAGALALQALAAGRVSVPWRWGATLVVAVLLAPVAAWCLDDPEASVFAASLVPQAARQALLLGASLLSLWLVWRYGRWLPGWEGAADEGDSVDEAPRSHAPLAFTVSPAEKQAGLITPIEPPSPAPDPALAVGRADLSRAGQLVRWLPALVLAIDLVSLSVAFNPFPPQIEAFPSTPILELLGQRPGRVAVFGGRVNQLPPTAAALHGIRSLHGVAPMVPTRTAQLLATIEGPLLDMRDPRVVEPFQELASLSHPLLDLLGVDAVVHSDPMLAERSGLTQIYASEVEGLAVLDRPTAGPRAFLCAAAEVVTDDDARLARLGDVGFDGHRLALLERSPEISLPQTAVAPLVPATVSGVDNALTVEVNASHAGVLVLTEAWDPGWTVTVDGEAASVHIVDHGLLGVVLSPGRHEVAFVYEPVGLLWAQGLCGAALLLCLWLGITVVRFRVAARRAPAPVPFVPPEPISEPGPVPPQLSPPAVAQAAPDLGSFTGHGVSVIIPAYDDTAKLRRALWSIRQTADMPYELIVSRAKQCVAKNRNAGLDLATQDLVIFLDDDVLLPPGWMSRLVAVLGARSDYGAICAHLTFADGSPQTRRPELLPGELWEITIPGTCFVYSRARVHDIRFDENYLGSQWEDTDWMWQVLRQGLKVGMSGDVWALHDHADSENKWLVPNAEYFRGKWGELPADGDNVSVSPEGYAAWSQPLLPGTDAQGDQGEGDLRDGEWASRQDASDGGPEAE
ncbi:MAG: hypothetical protein ACI9EF_000742 [Pseudohongiellaceae bacterium]|jgi:hypothetical protein